MEAYNVSNRRPEWRCVVKPEAAVFVPTGVLFREVQGEAVILNVNTGIYFGLDEVGTQMWHSLTKHSSLSKAEVELAGIYAVDRACLHRDLRQFVEELVSRQLLNCTIS